jgi:hypothetical protein
MKINHGSGEADRKQTGEEKSVVKQKNYVTNGAFIF